MTIFNSKITLGILMVALITIFNYKINSHVDRPAELSQRQGLSPAMQSTVKSKTTIESRQTEYPIDAEQGPIKSEFENFNTVADLMPPLDHYEPAHEDHPVLATTNAYPNYKVLDAIERDLEDTVQFDEDDYEITLAYASDIGLELDFYDLSEEEQYENYAEDETTDTASDQSLNVDNTANSNNSNQTVMDWIEATEPGAFHEDRLQGIKQLSLLLFQQSQAEDLIIKTLNNLTADSDRTISATAFDALDHYIINQEKHNSENLSTKDNDADEDKQVEDDLSLENDDDSVEKSGGNSVVVEAII